jgi:hypothetical protein
MPTNIIAVLADGSGPAKFIEGNVGDFRGLLSWLMDHGIIPVRTFAPGRVTLIARREMVQDIMDDACLFAGKLSPQSSTHITAVCGIRVLEV